MKSSSKDAKKSVKRLGGNVPGAGTPGQSASKVATPKMSMGTMAKMKAYLAKKGRK
jgi:hypothetical protein